MLFNNNNNSPNNNHNNNRSYPHRQRGYRTNKRSAEDDFTSRGIIPKRASRRSTRIPDPPLAGSGPAEARRSMDLQQKAEKPLAALYKEYLDNNPSTSMTPTKFKAYHDGMKALNTVGGNFTGVLPAVEESSSSTAPINKENKMHGRYAWKSTILDDTEPRILFHKGLRDIYMRKAVVYSLTQEFPRVLREEWKQKATLLHENIDAYFSSINDEKTKRYEDSVDIDFVHTKFNFDVNEYITWFRPDMNKFILFIQDYIRCRRQGIPVLKLEYPNYKQFTKYLWKPEVLKRSKGRITFDHELQKQRMDFVLCNNIVYIEQDPEFRRQWLKWSSWTITFCNDFLNDWPMLERESTGPRYISIKKTHRYEYFSF